MSEAYEIYKNTIDGLTCNGDELTDFNDMPDKFKKGWEAIETYHNEEIKKISAPNFYSNSFMIDIDELIGTRFKMCCISFSFGLIVSSVSLGCFVFPFIY